ncbi:GerMN domain-containing protein [Geobacter pickeringii]|uniref:Sporulation protein n=1 Tax=Geobacter pickeringii TaxID=345632 RepID=A0A0B5BEH7_9BACT|nr:GerMN domain-containing protein [Geobacter pickeringii]AJE02466.1 sporulation protein [Geobacter pickeringii]
MKRTKPRKWSRLIVVAFLVAATVLGLLIFQKYRTSRELPVAQSEPKPSGTFRVTLFFATPDAEGLAREGRELDACEEMADCVEEVVDELVNGPVGELQPTLPPSAVVRGVRIVGETAVIDFGKELVAGLPGGSSAELAAVYSVVDTVCLNFPAIKGVKFLVEGKDAETLAGHVDLRRPIPPDYTLEKTDEKVVKP